MFQIYDKHLQGKEGIEQANLAYILPVHQCQVNSRCELWKIEYATLKWAHAQNKTFPLAFLCSSSKPTL